MARSFVEDPLMACNFAMIEVPIIGVPPIAFPFKTIRSALSQGNFVGFSGMTVPTMNLETREIRQGNWPYIHQVATGFSSGGQVTLRQAVLPLATDMYFWWLQSVNGVLGPRRNFIMAHTRLDKALPARNLVCANAIPVSWKPASDFDANDSSVSLEEITLHVQRIDVIPIPLSDIFPGAF